jgi:hypothetical protein
MNRPLEVLGVGAKIILKFKLKRQAVRMWNLVTWLTIYFNSGIQQRAFELHSICTATKEIPEHYG